MSASDPPPPDPTPLDLRLVPAAVAAWAGMGAVVVTAAAVWAAGAAAAVLGAVAAALARRGRRSAPLALVAVVLAVTAAVGGLRLALVTHGPVADLARDGAVAETRLTVDSVTLVGQPTIALVRATLTELTARGATRQARLPVVVFASGDQRDAWAALQPGDAVTATARLQPADRTDAAAAQLRPLAAPTVTRPSAGWRAAVEHVRQGLRDAVAGAHPDQAALLPALVVGDTTLMSATLKQDFKATGLTHLTAVSGANLTILLAFLLGCARAVGVRGRVLNVIALAGVAAFVVLCHSEPSVLRAAAMGLVGLAALGHSARPGLGLRHLCAAVIALVWIDPWLACSFGFALSVLACAGLLVWGRPWTEALARWLPRWAAEAVAVPLAAQLATQPVVAYLSGAVSLTGLIANALAGPCVAPATVAGLVTALAAALWAPLGAVVGRAAAWTVEPILQIARRAAALPGATHTWPADPLGLAALGLVCLLTAGLLPRLLRRRWASVAAALVLVVALLRPPYQPGWPPDGWTVVACDVGQGDAVAVRVADKAVLLLDVGPPDAGLATCLGSLGVDRVALVVLSHLHSDHVGGLAELLAGWPVGAVLVGPGLAASVTLDPARAAGVEVVTAEEDTVYTVGDAAVEVIAAPPAPAAASADTGESSAENDASLLVRVTAGGLTLLATGDLEATGQSLAVARHPDLAADILKVPHHGSASQDEAFLAATHATLAVISVGAANDYGHPAAATVTTLSRLGMTVLRTDAHGAIAIAKENNTLTITTQR